MKTPASLITNLAYLLVAIFVFPMSKVVAAALAAAALASGAYHYVYTRLTRSLDRMFVMVVPVSLLYATGMVGPIGASALLAGCFYIGFKRYPLEMPMGVMVGLLAGYVWPRAIIPLLLLGVAVAASQAGERHAKPAKRYDVLHALWHVFSAVAVGAYSIIAL